MSITATYTADRSVGPIAAEIDWGEGAGWEQLAPGMSTAEHTFRARGVKQVRLRLTDGAGATEPVVSRNIEIVTALPTIY